MFIVLGPKKGGLLLEKKEKRTTSFPEISVAVFLTYFENPPYFGGPMVAALKKCNGGRVLSS